jgi:hypothetical protein
MSAQNHNNKPFMIVAYTFVWLLFLGFILPKSFWKAWHLHEVSLISSLKVPTQKTHKSTYHPKKKNAPLKDLVKDTIEANVAVSKIIRNDVAIESNDSSDALNTFLTALKELAGEKRKKVRIGYFGDSMIEGDLITQTIRNILQNRFGGNGVGYIPVSSVVAHYRQTVRVKTNEKWETIHYKNNKAKKLLGISGSSFLPLQDAAVLVQPGSGKHVNQLYNLSIMMGSGMVEFTCNQKTYTLNGTQLFNEFKIPNDSNAKNYQMNFATSTTPIYGFVSESKTGVILDNYSFRGTSGTELVKLNFGMLEQMNAIRPYDLLVLHYGPNLLYNDSITNFSYYQKQLEKSIRYLKKAFPNTDILIISTADKAFKTDGEYQTGKGVENLLLAQEAAAKKYHCAFFNLYEAMGGYNSMKTWVEKKPILAGTDYTHFNQSGSAKIGRLIGNALLNKYEQNSSAH